MRMLYSIILFIFTLKISSRIFSADEKHLMEDPSYELREKRMYIDRVLILKLSNNNLCCGDTINGQCDQLCKVKIQLNCATTIRSDGKLYNARLNEFLSIKFESNVKTRSCPITDTYYEIITRKNELFARHSSAFINQEPNRIYELYDRSFLGEAGRIWIEEEKTCEPFYGIFCNFKCSQNNSFQVCTADLGLAVCTGGRTGVNCDINILPCANNLCLNNGVCVPEADNEFSVVTTCSCLPGISGEFCETFGCEQSTCENGFCTLDSATCVCPEGYTGINCRIKLCSENYCKNGGTCNQSDDSFYCTCREGFVGERCENSCFPLCVTNQGLCKLSGNIPSCHCNLNFEGISCASSTIINNCPVPDLCSNAGNCVANGATTLGYTCACPEGWSGRFCEAPSCNRQNCVNGQCLTGGRCICEIGFSGASCDETDCSRSKACLNGGACIAASSSATTCNCLNNYVGLFCEKKCLKDCGINGKCVETTNGLECQCTSDFFGPTCRDSFTELNCEKLGCQNDSFCVVSSEIPSCKCKETWTGADCSKPICNQDNCKHGVCWDNVGCICNRGFVGNDCSMLTCQEDEVCKNNGKCVTDGRVKSCLCNTDFFSGTDCGLICLNGCNNGKCTFNQNGAAECKCNSGFFGSSCTEVDKSAGQFLILIGTTAILSIILVICVMILLTSFICFGKEKDMEAHGIVVDIQERENNKAWSNLAF